MMGTWTLRFKTINPYKFKARALFFPSLPISGNAWIVVGHLGLFSLRLFSGCRRKLSTLAKSYERTRGTHPVRGEHINRLALGRDCPVGERYYTSDKSLSFSCKYILSQVSRWLWLNRKTFQATRVPTKA